MTDLFDLEEAVDERAAIMAADAIAFDEEKLHQCEVSWIVRAHFPDGNKAAEYLGMVEKKRGKEAANKLRADCREAWKHEQETRKAQRAQVYSGKVAR